MSMAEQRKAEHSMADSTTARRSAWIPWAFVGFFGVVIAVNAVLLYAAFASWTGIGVDDAYRRGLEYNRQIAEEDAQTRLGWRVDLAFAATGPREGRLDVGLADRYGNLLDRAAVRAQFFRPVHQGHDFTADLPHVGLGHYAADLRLPLPGLWEVRVEAEDAAGTYRLRHRVMVR